MVKMGGRGWREGEVREDEAFEVMRTEDEVKGREEGGKGIMEEIDKTIVKGRRRGGGRGGRGRRRRRGNR